MKIARNLKSKNGQKYWKVIDDEAVSVESETGEIKGTVVFRSSASGQFISTKIQVPSGNKPPKD